MSNTRIAVAGAGLIGARHAELAAASPTCALAALVDPAPGARPVAERLGVPLFGALEDLLTRERPDAVIIASPNALHAAQARLCIEVGLAVLIEKPVTATLAEGEALLAAAAAAGARVLVGHHRAHSPLMTAARAVIASGRLGRLVALQGSAVFAKPDHYFEAGPWRRESGGGPILINLIHEIHSLRMLMGEIVQVHALASDAVRGFAVEDTVALSLRFANGALGSFLLSDTAASPRSWEQTSRENPTYDAHDDEDCYVVMGTLGSLAIPTLRLRTYADAASRSWWKPLKRERLSCERADPLALQLEHFGQVARGEVAPLVSLADGLANLRVIDAVAASAASGRPIDLAPIHTTESA
jgi:predicted dehydrogenase